MSIHRELDQQVMGLRGIHTRGSFAAIKEKELDQSILHLEADVWASQLFAVLCMVWSHFCETEELSGSVSG